MQRKQQPPIAQTRPSGNEPKLIRTRITSESPTCNYPNCQVLMGMNADFSSCLWRPLRHPEFRKTLCIESTGACEVLLASLGLPCRWAWVNLTEHDMLVRDAEALFNRFTPLGRPVKEAQRITAKNRSVEPSPGAYIRTE